MKRLAAMLLVLFLPLCAVAETYQLTIGIEVDEALFDTYVKESAMLDPDAASFDRIDTITQLLRRTLDGLKLEILAQEDAAEVNVSLGSGKLLDMTIHTAQDELYMTSSLLPGYALVAETTNAEGHTALTDELNRIDWKKVNAGVEAAVKAWLSDIEPTTAQGTYAGDAFEGGTKCTTWILSDMDIAALASGVMTEDVRNAVSLVMMTMGLDASDLLKRFDDLNDKVADEDVYIYFLRIVKNDAGEVVGMSLTILQENAQVATFSLGLGDEEARLVAGLGLDNQNYWWEFTVSKNTAQNITSIYGVSREWTADKSDGFAYVKTWNDPVTDYEWYCNIRKVGGRYLWDAAVCQKQGIGGYNYLCSSNGTYAPSTKVLDCSWSVGGGLERPITVNIDFAAAEAIAPLADGLKHCSMTDPAMAEESEKLMQQFSTTLAVRLIKLLPMDLILKLYTPVLP